MENNVANKSDGEETMKGKVFFAGAGFAAGITCLSTVMIPVLSLVLVVLAFIFTVLGWGAMNRGMSFAAMGMATLGLFINLVYLFIVVAGRA